MKKTKWSPRPSILSVIILMVVWVLLWGDPSPGNFVAGLGLALFVTWVFPMPRGVKRRFTLRPLAFINLVVRFLWDVVVASLSIMAVIVTGRRPREAIIKVQTRAHSDGFLATTAGFTAMVPGSIVLDAHRRTGVLYIHFFDIPDGEDGIKKAHDNVLVQEERILRAMATNRELKDAGFKPGWRMGTGRLSDEEYRAHIAESRVEVEREVGA